MRGVILAGCAVVLLANGSAGQEFQTNTPPFQVCLLGLHRQRDVMLVRGPWIWVDEEGAQRTIENRTPRNRSTGGPVFYARIRITTDPPTFFRQAGNVRLDEAVDDLDTSLEPTDEEIAELQPRGSQQRAAYDTRDVRFALSLPDQPGKTIKRLKGTIPVVLQTRSKEPVAVLDVSAARGKSLQAGGATVSIQDVKIEPDHSATIKLLAKLESEKGDFRDRVYQEQVAARLVDVVQRQIDLVDDQTRPVVAYASTTVRRNEVRGTLRVRPDEAFGAPDRVRVWGLAQTVQQIPFDFKGVPLP